MRKRDDDDFDDHCDDDDEGDENIDDYENYDLILSLLQHSTVKRWIGHLNFRYEQPCL